MSTPQEMVEQALAASTADGCIAIVEETSAANIRWAANTLTTNGATRTRQLVVIALVNGASGTCAGVVARSTSDADDISDVVRRAEAAARENLPADDAQPLLSPAEAGDGGGAGGWDTPTHDTSFEVFSGFTPGLGEMLGAARGEGRVLSGFAEHAITSTYLGSSTGVRLHHEQPTGKVEVTARSADGTRSAWTGAATRDFTDVDAGALDATLRRRLGWAERRVDLPPGRYETVLPPSAVADLMIYLYWTASARESYDGRTVFSRPGGGTRVGDQLSTLPITLRSDPYAAGMQCAPFVVTAASGSDSSVFDNGHPVAPVRWIDDGVLTALMTTRHSAALTGLPMTPAVDNLVLDVAGASGDVDAMVASTSRGLLLTCLWYIREVDPRTLLLTGLTRDGIYLVEGGEVVGAVNNFRFNESPVDLLGRVVEAGATTPTLPREWSDYFTRAAMPPMRVPDFNMSSVSQAS